MKLLIIAFIIYLIFWWLLTVFEKSEEERYELNFKKKWERDTMTNYRAHIICNDIILARTFSGKTCSEVLNEAIDYSIKEAGDFPDVVMLKKNIIYL